MPRSETLSCNASEHLLAWALVGVAPRRQGIDIEWKIIHRRTLAD